VLALVESVSKMCEETLSYDPSCPTRGARESRTLGATVSDRQEVLSLDMKNNLAKTTLMENMKLDDCKPVEIANSRKTGVGNMTTETLSGYLWTMKENMTVQMQGELVQWALLKEIKTSGSASHAPKLKVQHLLSLQGGLNSGSLTSWSRSD
jgi:hypothetical protein